MGENVYAKAKRLMNICTIFNAVDQWTSVGKKLGVVFFFVFFFFVLLRGMQDLSSPARDGTHAPCTENSSLNHWTTKEVPADLLRRRGGNEGRKSQNS